MKAILRGYSVFSVSLLVMLVKLKQYSVKVQSSTNPFPYVYLLYAAIVFLV